jgi:hypothetical protein
MDANIKDTVRTTPILQGHPVTAAHGATRRVRRKRVRVADARVVMVNSLPASRFSVDSRISDSSIIMSQGPAPPNPLMVERFQSVVSSLFQQVRLAPLAMFEGLSASSCVHSSDFLQQQYDQMTCQRQFMCAF